VGLKPAARDLALFTSDVDAAAAALFTRNHFPGAPIILGRETIKGGVLRAIVANSRCSNVATGSDGLANARRMAAACAAELQTSADRVLVSSTGVIGVPLPIEKIAAFVRSVDRCVVIEEGDPVLADALRAAGLQVEAKPESFRFGELNVERVRRILARDASPEPEPTPGKPPQLCEACPYHPVYGTLRKLDCIVAGDIGCYTLGVLPPYQGMDTCVAMGASLGVGLGLRHALPEKDARRVVSIIGDSTFVHTGLNGLVEMIYNPPATGHVLVVLDNGTTAMTGQQEHPGTGRTLGHDPTGKVSIEGIARALGVPNVDVIDPMADAAGFERLLLDRLERRELSVIVARRPCVLAAADIRRHEKAAAEKLAAASCAACAEPENV